jgi:predicted dehydrogenase
MKLKRRVFIKKSMLASAGLALGAPAYIKGFAQVKPSDMINVAVCGIHGRGGSHFRAYTDIRDTRVVALCDPVEYLFEPAIASIERAGGPKPTKTVADWRNLLDDKDIDIISVATPGYLHALLTITSCQAGKDVYCEKPLSYNISEGRKMVQAVNKYNRIVQVGTQHRSNKVTQKAVEMLHKGVIGDIYMGRGVEYKGRRSIGRKPNTPVPEGVNWDLFRGTAPMIPFNENHYFYNWHWYWDTSTSEHGNNGVHWMDQVRWGMNITEHPRKIACTGGFYFWDSDQEVPNFQVSTYEYASGQIMELEIRSLPNAGGSGMMEWYGEKGWATLQGNKFEYFLGQGAKQPTETITMAELPQEVDENGQPAGSADSHFQNFVDCVKSRKSEDLIAPIENGHISTAQMHLGNIAYRTGRTLVFDGKTEKFVNDKEADSYLARPKGGRKPYNIPDVV